MNENYEVEQCRCDHHGLWQWEGDGVCSHSNESYYVCIGCGEQKTEYHE